MQRPNEQLRPSTSELCAASPPTITLHPTAGQAASCTALQTLLLDCNVLQRTLLYFKDLHSALKVHLVDALPVPSQTKHLFLTTHRCICGVCIKTLPEAQRNQGLTPKLANRWRFSKKFDHQVAPCA